MMEKADPPIMPGSLSPYLDAHAFRSESKSESLPFFLSCSPLTQSRVRYLPRWLARKKGARLQARQAARRGRRAALDGGGTPEGSHLVCLSGGC
jgi:hypothetical protein